MSACCRSGAKRQMLHHQRTFYYGPSIKKCINSTYLSTMFCCLSYWIATADRITFDERLRYSDKSKQAESRCNSYRSTDVSSLYSGFHTREETINQMIDAGSAGILARPILIQSNSAVTSPSCSSCRKVITIHFHQFCAVSLICMRTTFEV